LQVRELTFVDAVGVGKGVRRLQRDGFVSVVWPGPSVLECDEINARYLRLLLEGSEVVREGRRYTRLPINITIFPARHRSAGRDSGTIGNTGMAIDFSLSSEQAKLQSDARDFAHNILGSVARLVEKVKRRQDPAS
jgi:hypothetical protein